jgi:uncharacterized protein YndB with AHSA1/START domain
MTSTDRAAAPRTESLAFDFDLPHPPETVWRALTDPDLLSEWLLPVLNFKPEAGNEFSFNAAPQPGWDGLVSCRMLEVDNQRKLSWSWVAGDIDTILTFTLEPTPSGTRLVVVQSGFKPDQKRNVAGARYGWKMMGEKLVEVLERV